MAKTPKVLYYDAFNAELLPEDADVISDYDGFEVAKYVLESTGKITSDTRYEPKKAKAKKK